jgi:hypothetical protein
MVKAPCGIAGWGWTQSVIVVAMNRSLVKQTRTGEKTF